MADVSLRLLGSWLATGFLVSLLLTPTTYITREGVTFIDTEIREATDHRQFVQTNLDLGAKEDLLALPNHVGDWTLVRQHQWDRVSSILNSDLLLAREYAKPGVYQPLTLVVVGSPDLSSFHPAPVCFRYQGYEILEEASGVGIPAPGDTWTAGGWLRGTTAGQYAGVVNAKELVVSRNDTHPEQQLVLYFYLKNEQIRGGGRITWVRVSMPIADASDDADQLALEQEFLAALVPKMFTVRSPDETLLEHVSNAAGTPAAALAVVGAIAPAAGMSLAAWTPLGRVQIRARASRLLARLPGGRSG